jgi:hypothetical protein
VSRVQPINRNDKIEFSFAFALNQLSLLVIGVEDTLLIRLVIFLRSFRASVPGRVPGWVPGVVPESVLGPLTTI